MLSFAMTEGIIGYAGAFENTCQKL